MTPYYDEDGVTIFHADCREILPGLEVEFDMAFTSPPYNLGNDPNRGITKWSGMGKGGYGSSSLADFAAGYDECDDAMPAAEYDRFQSDAIGLMWSVLSDVGAIFYNHKPRVQGKVAKLPTDYGDGLPLRQVIIWDRGLGLNFSPDYFLPKCEWIMVWAKPAWMLTSRSASQVGDVWHVPPEGSSDHPAAFPIGLPARAIESCAPRSVLDPFMGSGTTLRAAADAGIRAVGIDTSERYCEVAANRLAQGVLDFGGAA